MIQAIRCYQLVKYLDQSIKKQPDRKPLPHKTPDEWIIDRSFKDIAEGYTKHKHLTYQEFTELIAYCIKNKYIQAKPSLRKPFDSDLWVDATHGRDLLDSIPLFPWWGLTRELLHKDGIVLIPLLTFFGGILVNQIPQLMRWLSTQLAH